MIKDNILEKWGFKDVYYFFLSTLITFMLAFMFIIGMKIIIFLLSTGIIDLIELIKK